MIKNYNTRMNREVKDFTSLKFVIDALSDVRDTQSWISMDFVSIFSRYELLEKVHSILFTSFYLIFQVAFCVKMCFKIFFKMFF